MNLEVLISCMHQKDELLVYKSGVTTDALIVNQCDHDKSQTWTTEAGQTIRMISTKERGLSNSRNMALKKAVGNICLLCDDDEHLCSNYESIILKAFILLPEADIIIFDIKNQPCRLKKTTHRLRYLELLCVSSWQIALRMKSFYQTGISFNPLMGAGSGNGAQEENMFLMDCHRAGLKIYYVPEIIGRVDHENSTWFHGYDQSFFYQRGCATRYLLGLPLSILYAIYYAIAKRKMYSNEFSFRGALSSSVRGILENPIHRQKLKQERNNGC